MLNNKDPPLILLCKSFYFETAKSGNVGDSWKQLIMNMKIQIQLEAIKLLRAEDKDF